MYKLRRSSTVIVPLILGFFASIIVTTPMLWAQGAYTPIVMWGSQGEGNGQFSGLNDIISTGQYIYVPDYENHRIQMFAAKGIDSSDNVYVTDAELLNIQKFDSDDQFLTKWGSEGEGDGQFTWLESVDIDSADNVYVADMKNHRIQKFTSDGNFIMTWGSKGEGDGQLKNPAGVALDSSDRVYVTDQDNGRIQVFIGNGTFIEKWGTTGEDKGQFLEPEGIDVDNSGHVYVADTGNNRVQVFVADTDSSSTPTVTSTAHTTKT